jgi:hypothetical protein
MLDLLIQLLQAASVIVVVFSTYAVAN